MWDISKILLQSKCSSQLSRILTLQYCFTRVLGDPIRLKAACVPEQRAIGCRQHKHNHFNCENLLKTTLPMLVSAILFRNQYKKDHIDIGFSYLFVDKSFGNPFGSRFQVQPFAQSHQFSRHLVVYQDPTATATCCGVNHFNAKVCHLPLLWFIWFQIVFSYLSSS